MTIDLAVQTERLAAPGTPQYGVAQANVSKLFDELHCFTELQHKLQAHERALEALGDTETMSADEITVQYQKHFAQQLKSLQVPQSEDPKWREMKKRVTAVHHPNQPMPWEDADVFVADSASSDDTRFKCPLTQNVITTPLVCTACGHAFERDAILQYLAGHRGRLRSSGKPCPVAGCSAMVHPDTNLQADAEFEVRLQRYRAQAERQRAEAAERKRRAAPPAATQPARAGKRVRKSEAAAEAAALSQPVTFTQEIKQCPSS
eukprot:EG_transcript_15800